MRVHGSLVSPHVGESLDWNNQIFANCTVAKCEISAGAMIFAGGDFGPNPQIKYSVAATQVPDFYSPIKGINEISFASKWTGDIPPDLKSFVVDDK